MRPLLIGLAVAAAVDLATSGHVPFLALPLLLPLVFRAQGQPAALLTLTTRRRPLPSAPPSPRGAGTR